MKNSCAVVTPVLTMKVKHLTVLPVIFLAWVLLTGFSYAQSPDAVNIGAVFTFNSVIGRATKVAMEAAVSDVNADPRILKGTKLRLIVEDANCSVFLGSVGGKMNFFFFPFKM